MIDLSNVIDILSKPSHDKDVKKYLTMLNLKRPMKDENYNGVCIMEIVKDKSLQFNFDEKPITKKQINNKDVLAEFYLYNIILTNVSNYILPFGFTKNSSYLDALEYFKITHYAERKNLRSWLLTDSEKSYYFAITFQNEKLEGIKSINIIVKYE